MARKLKNEEKKQAEASFQDYLRRHHVKLTSPRAEILQAVLNMGQHFEAEQLLFKLRQRGLRVGKATIYRTLPLLVDSGILKQVHFSDQQAHYEFALGELPHDHMVCRQCGRIIEFSSTRVQVLRDELAGEHEFIPLSHRFQISGKCSSCTAAEES